MHTYACAHATYAHTYTYARLHLRIPHTLVLPYSHPLELSSPGAVILLCSHTLVVPHAHTHVLSYSPVLTCTLVLPLAHTLVFSYSCAPKSLRSHTFWALVLPYSCTLLYSHTFVLPYSCALSYSHTLEIPYSCNLKLSYSCTPILLYFHTLVCMRTCAPRAYDVHMCAYARRIYVQDQRGRPFHWRVPPVLRTGRTGFH